MNSCLKLKILLFLFIIIIIILYSKKELFAMPGNKESYQQMETSTNISKLKKIDKSAFSMILDINSYSYNINHKVCEGPKGCKTYVSKGYGFKPEEIDKYKVKNIIKNGQVNNELMVPFLLEAFKECYKNIEEQNKTIKDMEEKLKEFKEI